MLCEKSYAYANFSFAKNALERRFCMKRNWSIIPEFEQREQFCMLSEQYQTAFEYNDFYLPSVYTKEEEVEKRIQGYCKLHRNRANDTLHGVFLDNVPCSDDRVIAEYSKMRMQQSMEIAKKLGVKGVVFHSALVPKVTNDVYIENWLQRQAEFFEQLLEQFPLLYIYLENTQEETPTYLLRLKKRLEQYDRFCFCLDYAHANISGMKTNLWIREMKEYIGHMHVNDNDGIADLHQVPGEGSIDWEKFKKETQDISHVSMLIEIRGLEKQRQALNYLSRI